MYKEIEIFLSVICVLSSHQIRFVTDIYPYEFTMLNDRLSRNLSIILSNNSDKIMHYKHSSCWSDIRINLVNYFKSNSEKFGYDSYKLDFDIISKENDNSIIYMRTVDKYTDNYFDDLKLHKKMEKHL